MRNLRVHYILVINHKRRVRGITHSASAQHGKVMCLMLARGKPNT